MYQQPKMSTTISASTFQQQQQHLRINNNNNNNIYVSTTTTTTSVYQQHKHINNNNNINTPTTTSTTTTTTSATTGCIKSSLLKGRDLKDAGSESETENVEASGKLSFLVISSEFRLVSILGTFNEKQEFKAN